MSKFESFKSSEENEMLRMKQDDWIEACQEIETLEAKLEIAIEALDSVEYECPNCTPALLSIVKEALTKIAEFDK